MAHLKVEKLRGRNGSAAAICSGSYIYGLNGQGDGYFGVVVEPEALLKAIRRCAARRALLIVGNNQRAAKKALATLQRKRAIQVRQYAWSSSARLVVAQANRV